MAEQGIGTYCHGFKVEVWKDFTAADFYNLCQLLQKSFPGFIFEPEPITEGGIEFVSWPGKTEKMYKTMRWHIYERVGRSVDWPRINRGKTIEEWKNNTSLVLAKEGYIINTVLKTWDGAPRWTLEELKLFAKNLEKMGLYVPNSTYPKASNL